jgi:hypothetical protein
VLESLETSFHQDPNGDGVIGLAGTVIEADGWTSLIQFGTSFYLDDSSGAGPSLKNSGTDVVAEASGWQPIGAEQTASGYEVAWRYAGTDQYSIWQTDFNGNCVSSDGVLSGTGPVLEALEPSFQQDLNGDGVIGFPTTVNLIGGGASTLVGGSGNNTYKVSTATGQATIYANESAGTSNELEFTGGITDNQLWFLQSGNDLQIDLLGTQTEVSIKNWFSGGGNQLQEITAGGLKINSQISQLVQAMATYSANNPGFDPTTSGLSSVPNNTNVQTTLAAAWHA